ncbi:hypothetical protein SBV1_1710055 [Verrucomicrobia bacterium]|nr:hypothetical protein SBV1_1710055 [Verrucomicrobiota bacterium]
MNNHAKPQLIIWWVLRASFQFGVVLIYSPGPTLHLAYTPLPPARPVRAAFHGAASHFCL